MVDDEDQVAAGADEQRIRRDDDPVRAAFRFEGDVRIESGDEAAVRVGDRDGDAGGAGRVVDRRVDRIDGSAEDGVVECGHADAGRRARTKMDDIRIEDVDLNLHARVVEEAEDDHAGGDLLADLDVDIGKRSGKGRAQRRAVECEAGAFECLFGVRESGCRGLYGGSVLAGQEACGFESASGLLQLGLCDGACLEGGLGGA